MSLKNFKNVDATEVAILKLVEDGATPLNVLIGVHNAFVGGKVHELSKTEISNEKFEILMHLLESLIYVEEHGETNK